MSTAQSAWVFISIDPATTSAGPVGGYDDGGNEYYSYDSRVGNFKNVKRGDLVFVKGKNYINGFGEIEEIVEYPDQRENRKCPKCGKMPEVRKKLIPKWRCSGRDCHYKFDDIELLIEKEKVVKFRASYKNTWRDANTPIDKQELLNYQLYPRQQRDSIRRIDPNKIQSLIMKIMGSDALPVSNFAELPDLIIGGHIVQVTKRRVGQQEFRLAMLKKNGESCLISGDQPACVLEAAHLKKFAKYESHDLAGGLLLRRDFHTLFDRHLIRINPKNWRAEVSPRIRQYETYSAIHLTEVKGDYECRPDAELLQSHFDDAALLF